MLRLGIIVVGVVVGLIYGTTHLMGFFKSDTPVLVQKEPASAPLISSSLFEDEEEKPEPLRVTGCMVIGKSVVVSFNDGRIIDENDPLLKVVRRKSLVYDGKTYKF